MPPPADVPLELELEVGPLVEAASRAWPQRVALRHGRDTVTFGELDHLVAAAAAGLAGAGVHPGGTVALLFENTPACVVAFLAAARHGARLIPLEPDTAPPSLWSLRDDFEQLTIAGPEAKLPAPTGRDHRLVAVERLSAAHTALPVGPFADPGPDAPFLYQYTSGSTGAPKAAIHTQANLVRGARIYQRLYRISPQDRVLAAVPLLHSYGMVAGLVTALLTGAQLVLLGRFAPEGLLRELQAARCTVLLGTPLLYDLLARAIGTRRLTPDTLRLCLSSGAPLAPAAGERFRQRAGLLPRQIYGSTEVGIIAAQRQADPHPHADGDVGRPVPGVRIRLVDDHGQPSAPGAPGNLLVRTPAMFAGYLSHPDATASAFQDGWYVTGDVAQVDAGRLRLVGRKDSFINVGGKKVNTVEVERVLCSHPLVAEAVVWGESLGELGGQVRASVVATRRLPAAELTAFCRERLLPHQVPARIEFVAALPRSAAGKVRRGGA